MCQAPRYVLAVHWCVTPAFKEFTSFLGEMGWGGGGYVQSGEKASWKAGTLSQYLKETRSDLGKEGRGWEGGQRSQVCRGGEGREPVFEQRFLLSSSGPCSSPTCFIFCWHVHPVTLAYAFVLLPRLGQGLCLVRATSPASHIMTGWW